MSNVHRHLTSVTQSTPIRHVSLIIPLYTRELSLDRIGQLLRVFHGEFLLRTTPPRESCFRLVGKQACPYDLRTEKRTPCNGVGGAVRSVSIAELLRILVHGIFPASDSGASSKVVFSECFQRLRQRGNSLCFLLASILLIPGLSWAQPQRIDHLKDLYLDTVLADGDTARAVIVTPDDKAYESPAQSIAGKVKQLKNVSLPIYKSGQCPQDILKTQNVIALGNMSNNAFIEKLYREWYVIVDLKYPGPGGYTVRSLHNPYGTGHNVIFIGGSDLEGVQAGTRVFLDLLKPEELLKVGWLMEISLGAGLKPPRIGEDISDWVVHTWQDSWRKTAGGEVGYKPGTFFGWSPISIAGALYYMTGQKEYLDYFKAMAMPDPRRAPLPNRTSDAFNDPMQPIVKSYHYRAHLLDCIYDLIEESPLFTDNERLTLTNRLLEHQYDLDPRHEFCELNGDRHALWHMMCIYTGSRYFSRYYPDPVWNRRIENARKGFRSLLGNPTWGERDTLEWVSTSIQPIMDFFLMDGYEDFVASGTAAALMKGLEILMTGDEVDDYNKYLCISLMNEAACMLKDSRYAWMVRQLNFDWNVFRIGQSYWPGDSSHLKAPVDLVGNLSVYPLARTDWEQAGKAIPAKKAFQIMSYRGGLSAADDYLLLDGFNGLGRNPFHLGTLLRVRMFGGKTLLSGYDNDVRVLFNGMVGSEIARCAALKDGLSTGDFAYVGVEAPNMPSSNWRRDMIYLKDDAFIVFDRITPGAEGIFDIESAWQFGAKLNPGANASHSAVLENGIRVSSAQPGLKKKSDSSISERTQAALKAGQQFNMGHLYTLASDARSIAEVEGGGMLIGGNWPAFLCAGNRTANGMSVKADFVYFDQTRLFVSSGVELTLNGHTLFTSNKPVSLFWHCGRKHLVIRADEPSRVQIAAAGSKPLMEISAQRGQHSYDGIGPAQEMTAQVLSSLSALGKSVKRTPEVRGEKSAPAATLKPDWTVDLKSEVIAIASSEADSSAPLWVSTKGAKGFSISSLSRDGRLIKSIPCGSEPLSLWPAKTAAQRKVFGLLAGFKDDTLRAYAEDGTMVWEVRAELDRRFIIGDHYDAPWFTDPHPPFNMSGVYSILVGDFWGEGSEQIAIGRPCTVELRALDGRLIRRLPTIWGTNSSLALLKKTDYMANGPMLLVGKNYTGNPRISGIGRNLQNISDNLFDALPPEWTDMHAWLQRGLNNLRVKDLDGNGQEEVIFTLSGHWNELRAYNSNTGKPLWIKNLGPGKKEDGLIRGMEIMDSGKQGHEITVGTKNGWVLSFDKAGRSLWQVPHNAPVDCMAYLREKELLAVGYGDGLLRLMNASGSVQGGFKFNSTVKPIFCSGNVYAGTASGTVSRFTFGR